MAGRAPSATKYWGVRGCEASPGALRRSTSAASAAKLMSKFKNEKRRQPEG